MGRRFTTLATAGAVLLSLEACSDAAAPTIESVAGLYDATTFTVDQGSGPEDLLSKGSFIDLTLKVDGTTAGRLFVSGGAEGGGDLDADLTGTWTLDSTTVTLSHVVDTFLRDMTFTVEAGRLVGEETFSEATLRVVLTKQ